MTPRHNVAQEPAFYICCAGGVSLKIIRILTRSMYTQLPPNVHEIWHLSPVTDDQLSMMALMLSFYITSGLTYFFNTHILPLIPFTHIHTCVNTNGHRGHTMVGVQLEILVWAVFPSILSSLRTRERDLEQKEFRISFSVQPLDINIPPFKFPT